MTATSYPAGDADWQGRFIFDMAESLARSARLDLHLWAPPGQLPSGVASALKGDDAEWLRNLLAQGGIAHLLRRQPFTGGFRALSLLRRLRRVYLDFAVLGRLTVIHANWIQNALPLWGTRLPALITVLGSDLALLASARHGEPGARHAPWASGDSGPECRLDGAGAGKYFGDLAEIGPIPFGVHERWFAVERTPETSNW